MSRLRKRLRVNSLRFSRKRAAIERPDKISYGEFDPGSGRTLAACLRNASRARPWSLLRKPSGERSRNT